jgi:hypothetical protein
MACQHGAMSANDLDVSELRDVLPVSVAVRLSDERLRAGLEKARWLLGPGAGTAALHGAAWLLAHDPAQHREQIDHMLQIAALRRQYLIEAEGQLLGAFQADPDLDDRARTVTFEETLDDLDRLEALLGTLTARAGGSVKVATGDLADAPRFAITYVDGDLHVTTVRHDHDAAQKRDN